MQQQASTSSEHVLLLCVSFIFLNVWHV
jgi:hypothetical protein